MTSLIEIIHIIYTIDVTVVITNVDEFDST